MKKGVIPVLTLVQTSVLVSLIVVCSQLAIPFPTGVPITLQTFAIALCGFVLGEKKSILAIGVYLLLGVIGIPVFANFKGGPGVLLGLTGGFLWGFFLLAFFCGLSLRFKRADGKQNRGAAILLCGVGLMLCHGLGVLQFYFLSGNSLLQSFCIASLPYILKDAISILLAGLLGKRLSGMVNKRNSKQAG